MCAAIMAARNGANVFVIEKNDKAGKAELREYKDIGIDYLEIGRDGTVYMECHGG